MSINSEDIKNKLIKILKEPGEDEPTPQITTIGQALNFIESLKNIPDISMPFIFIGGAENSIAFEWARNKRNIMVEFHDDIIVITEDNNIEPKTVPATLHKAEMLPGDKLSMKEIPFNNENPADNHGVMLELLGWFNE